MATYSALCDGCEEKKKVEFIFREHFWFLLIVCQTHISMICCAKSFKWNKAEICQYKLKFAEKLLPTHNAD